MARNYRSILIAGVVGLSWSSGAFAQAPQPPGTIPDAGPNGVVCQQLETQLASIDNGSVDPSRAGQRRQYEDALNRQQAELDRVVSRSRKLGCSGGGFFALFVQQPPECGAMDRQMQQMHANVDRLTMELQRLQSGNATGREEERRNVISALARNDCGPQYRSAAAGQQRGLFESLFGPGTVMAPNQSGIFQSSTYRTLCVRTCDGYYFPISFSTVPDRFSEDERTCQRMCPAARSDPVHAPQSRRRRLTGNLVEPESCTPSYRMRSVTGRSTILLAPASPSARPGRMRWVSKTIPSSAATSW